MKFRPYRVTAVGFKKISIILKNYNFCEFVKSGAISWKIDIFRIWEFFCTHVVVVIFCTAIFVSTESNFSYFQISFPNFALFSAKSPRVTERSVSQENAFKKSKYQSPFLHKTISSNNCFTLIENNFRFLR